MGILNIEINQDDDFIYSFNHLKEKYGSDFQYLNGFHESQLDFSQFIAGFIDQDTVADTTIDGNANAHHKDVCSLKGEKGKSEDKLFAFNKIYYELKKKYGLRTAREWLEAEWTGAFYMHDAPSSSVVSYCYAYDLSRLAREGLFFLDDYNNKAPQHLTTFIDDVIEFISFFSNRTSGACGLPNVLVWCTYFWKKDIEDGYYLRNPDYYLEQAYQKFIFRINQPFLRVDQSAFVNVSIFDRYYYESLFGGLIFPDGSFAIDYIDEFMRHQKIFMEVVSDIRHENMFTFPVLTYSLLKRDDLTKKEINYMIKTKNYHIFKDNEFARWCSDHNCKWYDSNFFMSSDVTTLSNCCRLLSDTSKLSGFINSIGGTALSIGSVKVSTINLMRIALESDKDEEKYLKILRDKTILNCKVLDRQRWIIKRNIQKGLLPNYCNGGVELDKQYSTIGILGCWEVIEYFGYITEDEFGNKYYTEEGIKFAKKIFDTLNDVKDNFYDEFGDEYWYPDKENILERFSFNIESVPAERAAVILCQKDNLLYERDTDKFIYSNQWIPLMEKCTIDEKLKLSSILDAECSGGSISHIGLESPFPNTDVAWDMLNKIAISDVIYFAFNAIINECKNHHVFIGTDHCPTCGEPTSDTWSRIVGLT